ncbi:hypothetical protein PInf_028723 [Phytophthora infestans]|nr:hypothetical protein PInf_028723 [Phytophthora infestans]
MAAGVKSKKDVGGMLSEALRAAMAEITVAPADTTATVSSVASCSSRSGAGASLTIQLQQGSGAWLVSMIAAILLVIQSIVCCGSTVSTLLSAHMEPRQELMDDDFAEELDIVDPWKASDVESSNTSGLRTNTVSVQLVLMIEAYTCSVH